MTIELEVAIESAKQGNDQGIVTLFRSFNPQLLRFLKNQAPNQYEDIASETWLAIAKGIANFNGNPHDFRSWMFSIARRKLVDHYRTAGKSKIAFENLRTRFSQEQSLNEADSSSEAAISNLSAESAIEELVNQLPPHHAEVLLLRILGELSVEEVAKIVEKSPEAVRVIQYRALNSLSKKFKRNFVTE
ncbi:MAG: sigma-70 family RNA polymerase sigma factor [Actinobacteria bacterium]|nr:sigma-70 family RNA polymerase sigma factor [Actinomycetota bacterium]